MAVKENEKIAKASQEWEYLRGDEAVKRMAFLREKWERDWNSDMSSAKEIGMEEVIKEVARKMLQEEIDKTIISKVTNLSLDEIEKLKKEINIK